VADRPQPIGGQSEHGGENSERPFPGTPLTLLPYKQPETES